MVICCVFCVLLDVVNVIQTTNTAALDTVLECYLCLIVPSNVTKHGIRLALLLYHCYTLIFYWIIEYVVNDIGFIFGSCAISSFCVCASV